ncbi:MAG: lipid-A-disaccharide synthase, partial [Pseudomonadota bacterium]
MRFGILAGEASGDRLGAGLMRALSRRHPKAEFVGIGGPLMEAEGLQALVPMERLAMNGIKEPVLRLPELVRILRLLLRTYRETPP